MASEGWIDAGGALRVGPRSAGAVPAGALTVPDVERIQKQFHEAHVRAYGYAAREDSVEFVNVRLTAIGVSPKPQLKALPYGTGDVQKAMKGYRPPCEERGSAKRGGFVTADHGYESCADETRCIPLSAPLDTFQRPRYAPQARQT